MEYAEFNKDAAKKYKDLEKAGLEPAAAQAVGDFILSIVKEFMHKMDWDAHKATGAKDLPIFEASVSRQLDRIRYDVSYKLNQARYDINHKLSQISDEISGARREFKNKTDSKACDLKGEIERKFDELKTDLMQSMVTLFLAQAGLTTLIAASLSESEP